MGTKETRNSVLTVGHSTRTLEEFIHLLQAHGVNLIVDVRTVPRSKHNPQFGLETLSANLRKSGIGYLYLKELGGLRHPRADSKNTAWRNLSFRGFADYMQSPEFELGLERLISIARNQPVAIMCAEALPWRCHRSLIADALTARGIEVEHIMTEKTRRTHVMTKWARVEAGQVTYPLINSLPLTEL